MNAREFLTQILPDTGHIVVARPIRNAAGSTWWLNEVVPTIDAALRKCTTMLWEQQDAFYAVSTYAAARVWNATKVNKRTGQVGGYETRTQANAQYTRTLFLDLDVKAGGKGFASQADALDRLRSFCSAVGLPRPLLVNSGWGIHAYWPFVTAIPSLDWEMLAEKLKGVIVLEGMPVDRPLIADQARVLRVPGTANFKHGTMREVRVLSVCNSFNAADLDAILDAYLTDRHVAPAPARPPRPASTHTPTATSPLGDNLGATNDPVNPGIVAYECAFFGEQVATRGCNASEPIWRAALGIAKFCEPQQPSLLAVSDGYADFSEAAMQAKVANWNMGPTLCAKIHDIDTATEAVCEVCPHWGQIKSPAVLGRIIPIAPAPVVTTVVASVPVVVAIPDPPWPYKRTTTPKKAVVLESEDANGIKQHIVVAPYDLYPISILRQIGVEDSIDENSVWRMHLPRIGSVDVTCAQTLLTDTRRLHAFLMGQGYYLSPDQAKSTQLYMSAYLQHLADKADRDKVYERLGWHNKHTTFVMPNEAYHRDGTTSTHNASTRINKVTKKALHQNGTFEAWYNGMKFYSGPGNEAYRFFLLAAFASPLYHMTGFKGVLIAASGETGRGKTTVLEGCASIYGEPEPMKVSGGKDGTTMNALYNIIGTYHSLPMLWDETTEREPDEVRKFMLNLPQGKGKERLLDHQREVTWECMVLSSANTDDVSRIVSSGKDTNPHLMRMVSVDFDKLDVSTSMKQRADHFRRIIAANYGHAGPLYLQMITANYEAIQRKVISTIAEIDTKFAAQSPERYWTATIACIYVAAQIVDSMGLLPFKCVDDLPWMLSHLHRMRDTVAQAQTSSENLLAEFLDRYFNNVLVLSDRATTNISNMLRIPNGPLYIRHEYDNNLIYVSRSLVMAHCTEVKTSFKRMEGDLFRTGVLLDRVSQKVLGADTPYSRGQVRCWKLDVTKMGGAAATLQQHAQQILHAGGGNVLPPKTKGAK